MSTDTENISMHKAVKMSTVCNTDQSIYKGHGYGMFLDKQ